MGAETGKAERKQQQQQHRKEGSFMRGERPHNCCLGSRPQATGPGQQWRTSRQKQKRPGRRQVCIVPAGAG